jgi:hypothetical protein
MPILKRTTHPAREGLGPTSTPGPSIGRVDQLQVHPSRGTSVVENSSM